MIAKQTFQIRNFISLVLTGCGLAMAISGFVLFVMPEGRIAYWNDWRLFDQNKEQWGALHAILSFAFVLFAAIHLCLNWSALLRYLRDRTRRTLTLRRELTAAVGLTLFLIYGSTVGSPPFNQIMQLGKAGKKSWYVGEEAKPPFAHAELMTLRQLTGKIDIDLQGALAFLEEQGLEADGDSTLQELAADTERSPAQLFEAMMLDDRLYR